MKVTICILLAANQQYSFFPLSFFGCVSGVYLTKEVEVRAPFERFLISRHHLRDWFGIVKSKSFSMDFACEKLLLKPVRSKQLRPDDLCSV